MHLKKCLSMCLAGLIMSPAMAVTIINKNSQMVNYTIATNGFLSKCNEGSVGVGGSVQWLRAGSPWLHPFCGGDGPTHVEVTVRGLSPLPVNCTPRNSHDPRLINKTAVVTVKSTQYGIECYSD